MFTSKHQLLLRVSQVREGVERVRLLPCLERVAPAVPKYVLPNPPTASAVEVEVIRRGVHEPEAALSNCLYVVGADPDHNDRVVRKRRYVEAQHHLLPHDGRFAELPQRAVRCRREVTQRVEERLARGVELRLGLFILCVAVCVQFVAAGAEECGREHVCDSSEKVGREVLCGR